MRSGPGGSATVVGLAPVGVEASVPAIEFLSDKSLKGTYYGSGDPAAELPGLANLALDGSLDVSRVVTHTTPLEGIGDGARSAAARRGSANRARHRRGLRRGAARRSDRSGLGHTMIR